MAGVGFYYTLQVVNRYGVCYDFGTERSDLRLNADRSRSFRHGEVRSAVWRQLQEDVWKQIKCYGSPNSDEAETTAC